jgi:hypothetical protein
MTTKGKTVKGMNAKKEPAGYGWYKNESGGECGMLSSVRFLLVHLAQEEFGRAQRIEGAD